jgi:hypothetical protein
VNDELLKAAVDVIRERPFLAIGSRNDKLEYKSAFCLNTEENMRHAVGKISKAPYFCEHALNSSKKTLHSPKHLI